MSLHSQVWAQVLSQLGTVKPEDRGPHQLNNTLRLLSKWRSVMIQNTLLQKHGSEVLNGPFAGMIFEQASSEGCHIAKVLGCYEQPLHPFIEESVLHGYTEVLNIGCAEGYYAVGLAMRMPDTHVFAYDTNLKAQSVCTGLAKRNGVAHRVSVSGSFTASDFADYQGRKVLVFCDLEGGEMDLLDPVDAPNLREMDIIVESHECLIPGATHVLSNRFKKTHQISLIQDDGHRSMRRIPDWFKGLAHLDQLLAVWEWRSGPTPWLVMRARVND